MGLSFSGALTPTGRTTTRANKAPTWSSTGNLGQTLGNKPFTANLLGTDPEGTTVKYGVYDGGVLPSGISLNTETGVLSGTPVNNPGVKTFPIYVTDGVDVIPQTFTLEIQNATPAWATLAGSLGTINENTSFSISLSATDENLDTLTFTKTAGTLPPGLTLASDGTISGTTGQVNQTTVYNFTVQVNDGATGLSSRAFSITVNNNINEPPVWSTAAGSLGILNEQTDFSYNLSVTDPDVDDTITYGVSSGTLPIGLSLNTVTGVISGNTGVATGNVTYDFMISAQDGHNPVIYRAFSIAVLNNVNEPPVWTTAAGSIGTFNQGASINFSFVATDQNGDGITYSITSGALPTGLTLSSAGVITGSTSQTGTFNFTVTATDTNSGTTARAFTITSELAGDQYWGNVVLSMHMDGANNGTTFTDVLGHTATATSFTTSTATTKFGTASALCAGANGSKIVIPSSSDFAFGSGDFTIEGWFYRNNTNPSGYSYLFDFRDSGPTEIKPTLYINDSTNKIDYYANGAIRITQSSTLSMNTWYHVAVTRSSGITILWINGSSAGTWADSLTYAQGQFVIGNYPNTTNYALNGNFDDLRVTKGVARYTSNFTVPTSAFIDGPVWSSSTAPAGYNGIAYSATVSATGTGVTYTLQSGSLPTGLSIASNGTISGTPTGYGSSTFTIRATDSYTSYKDQVFTLNIASVYTAWFGGAQAEAVSFKSTKTNSYGETFTAMNTNSYGGATTNVHTGVVKFNADGTPSWAITYGPDSTNLNQVNTVTLKSNGNEICTGYSKTTTTDYCATFVELTNSGSFVSAKYLSGIDISENRAVVTDSSGNIYYAGYGYPTGGNYQHYFIKVNSSGTIIWQKSYQMITGFAGNVTAVYNSVDGYIYACGHTQITSGSNVGMKAYLLKLDPANGSIIWTKTIGGSTGVFLCRTLDIDSSGNIYMNGMTNCSEFGGNNTSHNAYVMKFDNTGALLWNKFIIMNRNDYSLMSIIDNQIYLSVIISGMSSWTGTDVIVLDTSGNTVLQKTTTIYVDTIEKYQGVLKISGLIINSSQKDIFNSAFTTDLSAPAGSPTWFTTVSRTISNQSVIPGTITPTLISATTLSFTNWSSVTSTSAITLTSGTNYGQYIGKQLVALIYNSTTAGVSNDAGKTWSSVTVPNGNWRASAWNGTTWCAVSSGTVAATSTDGVTWTQRTLPSNQDWIGIAWNGSVFSVIGNNSSSALTSPDGITWTARTLPASNLWRGPLWTGTQFVVVQYGGTTTLTSTDGITWTQHTGVLPTTSNWIGMAIGNGIIVSSPGGGTYSYVATSTDGITWAQRTIPVAGAWSGLAWNGGTFCAVSASGTTAITSTDGITWVQRTIPTGTWISLAWNGTNFVAINQGGNSAIYSPDGITWTTTTLPSTANWWYISSK